MGAGRKIIPIEIKKAKGTNRKHREKQVPKTSDKRPHPPAWLNKRAKQIFWHMSSRLNDLGMLTRSHTEILALLSARMEEVERFDKILNENGKSCHFYKTKTTMGEIVLKEHPAVHLREKAARHVHSLLVEFGLTPSAAQKVGIGKTKPKNNEFNEF